MDFNIDESNYLDMSDEFLKIELNNQFKTASTIRKPNLLKMYKQKIAMQKSFEENDNNEFVTDTDELEEKKFELYGIAVNYLKDVCGINIDIESSIDYDIIDVVYEMWIVKLHENIINYYTRYIIENKNALAGLFKTDKTSNLSVKASRKRFSNKVDATIALRLPEIVCALLDDESTYLPENIINILYMTNPDNYDYATNKNMYDIIKISFDVFKFQEWFGNMYKDEVLRANLHTNIFERLLPFLKEK